MYIYRKFLEIIKKILESPRRIFIVVSQILARLFRNNFGQGKLENSTLEFLEWMK